MRKKQRKERRNKGNGEHSKANKERSNGVQDSKKMRDRTKKDEETIAQEVYKRKQKIDKRENGRRKKAKKKTTSKV